MPPLRLGLGCLLLVGCTRSAAFVRPDAASRCEPGDGATTTNVLRVVSFNIKSGLMSSLAQVGAQLEALHPDLVALQEVDVGVDRTGRVDQARQLGERLGLQHLFAGAIVRGGGDYGIALLTRLPLLSARKLLLGGPVTAWEPRVAIDATVCLAGQPLRVVALHADNTPWGAVGNVRSLIEQLGPLGDGPLLLLGDLNATPQEAGPRALEHAPLFDELHAFDEGPTFVGSDRRIDYVFTSAALHARVVNAGRVVSAVSDHLPVFADFASR